MAFRFKNIKNALKQKSSQRWLVGTFLLSGFVGYLHSLPDGADFDKGDIGMGLFVGGFICLMTILLSGFDDNSHWNR